MTVSETGYHSKRKLHVKMFANFGRRSVHGLHGIAHFASKPLLAILSGNLSASSAHNSLWSDITDGEDGN